MCMKHGFGYLISNNKLQIIFCYPCLCIELKKNYVYYLKILAVQNAASNWNFSAVFNGLCLF